jgi:hypothetical protein
MTARIGIDEAATAPKARNELRWGLFVLAFAYLCGFWLDAAGSKLPQRLLPRPLLSFVQTAELFPNAARLIVEWRALGYRCADGKFEELDLRPYFPIHGTDKEGRFQRAMFFHHAQKRVLQALDLFITHSESALGPEHVIGGVKLLSLRIPIPDPGANEQPHGWRPIEQYPTSVVHKVWYVTPSELRERRCARQE